MQDDEKARQFFEKIIQLPFQMPVAAYTVSTLVSKYVLGRFGPMDREFTDQISNLVQLSVGTNPRAVKRLLNVVELMGFFGASKAPVGAGPQKLDAKDAIVLVGLIAVSMTWPWIADEMSKLDGAQIDLFVQGLATGHAGADDDDMISQKLKDVLGDLEDGSPEKVKAFFQVWRGGLHRPPGALEALAAWVKGRGSAIAAATVAPEAGPAKEAGSKYQGFIDDLKRDFPDASPLLLALWQRVIDLVKAIKRDPNRTDGDRRVDYFRARTRFYVTVTIAGKQPTITTFTPQGHLLVTIPTPWVNPVGDADLTALIHAARDAGRLAGVGDGESGAGDLQTRFDLRLLSTADDRARLTWEDTYLRLITTIVQRVQTASLKLPGSGAGAP